MGSKSDRIQELLNNPLLKDAFANVKAHYLEQLGRAPVNGSQENIGFILDLKRMMKLVDEVETDLRLSIQSEKLDEYEPPAYLGDLRGQN